MYICIDGVTGSGKRTQTELLASHMIKRGLKTEVIKDPTPPTRHTPLMSEQEKLILWHTIKRLENKDKVLSFKGRPNRVLLSRGSYYSSIAYQHNDRISKSWINTVNKNTPRGDLTIILDVKEKTALHRCKWEEQLGTVKLLTEARKTYREIGESNVETVLVDGEGTAGAVHERVRKVVEEFMC